MDLVRGELADDLTVDITTIGRRSGLPRRIEIWMLDLDGRFFITGTSGARDWFANVCADPHLVVHLKRHAHTDLPALATRVDNLTLRRAVLEDSVAAWYRGQEPLDELVANAPMVEVVFVQQFAVERWRVESDDEPPIDLAVPVIDGVPMYLLTEPDALPGVTATLVDEHPQHWLGSPVTHFTERDSATVIGDTCSRGTGNGACCGLLATITISEPTVVWESFWSYGQCAASPETRFVFDLAQYRSAIEAFKDAPVRHVMLEQPD